jgi:hypothetical protein
MPTKDLWDALMPNKLTHARHDPAICLVPGLFRSLKRGDYKKEKLHLTYDFGPKERIEFLNYEPLGAEELRVLQGLIAMAGKVKLVLCPDVNGKTAKVLRDGLELEGNAVRAEALVVKSSLYELAKEIGYTTNSGSVVKQIEKCIARLWAVSIKTISANGWSGYRLLSSVSVSYKTGNLLVAINPRITEAIFGSKPHTRINMAEVRKLNSGPARILHQRLSAMISQGQTKKILPDTLLAYIWPDSAEGSTLRMRRLALRKAIDEIVATDAWEIKDGYQISRKGDFKKKLKPKKKAPPKS